MSLLEQAIKIPPKERVVLAEMILESIEKESSEIKKAWIDEAHKRMKSVAEGKPNLLDFNKLYAQD